MIEWLELLRIYDFRKSSSVIDPAVRVLRLSEIGHLKNVPGGPFHKDQRNALCQMARYISVLGGRFWLKAGGLEGPLMAAICFCSMAATLIVLASFPWHVLMQAIVQFQYKRTFRRSNSPYAYSSLELPARPQAFVFLGFKYLVSP